MVGKASPARAAADPPLSRLGAIGVCGLLLVLIVLNRPRVDALWRGSVPALLPVEQKMLPIVPLQSMRATTLLFDRAQWQRRHLRRLDQAQAVAGRLGIGRDAGATAFGRLDMPELPEVYDAVGLLGFAERGRQVDPDVVRRALGPYVFKEPEPRPAWLPARRDLAAAAGAGLDDPGSRRRRLAAVSLAELAQYGFPSSIGSAIVARFSNRVRFLRNVSLMLPVGPLRFLATMISAMPGWSLGS